MKTWRIDGVNEYFFTLREAKDMLSLWTANDWKAYWRECWDQPYIVCYKTSSRQEEEEATSRVKIKHAKNGYGATYGRVEKI